MKYSSECPAWLLEYWHHHIQEVDNKDQAEQRGLYEQPKQLPAKAAPAAARAAPARAAAPAGALKILKKLPQTDDVLFRRIKKCVSAANLTTSDLEHMTTFHEMPDESRK